MNLWGLLGLFVTFIPCPTPGFSPISLVSCAGFSFSSKEEVHSKFHEWVGSPMSLLLLLWCNHCKLFPKLLFRNMQSVQALLWAASIGTLSFIVLITYPMRLHYTPFQSAAYLGLSKIGWCLSLSWIVVACIKGYGGIVNTILSNKFFQVLARGNLIFSLLHMELIRTFFFSFHQPIELTNYFLVSGKLRRRVITK